MSLNFKISIPKPCHENWNEMTPDEKGRFCNVCSKSVVDFTSMKENEVQDFFIENQDKKVCGRFRNEQIESTFKFNIPQTLLSQKRSFSKAFLLSLFVVMGASLFSCKNHQNQTLGEVAIVNDSINATEENTLTGDTTVTVQSKDVKMDDIQVGEAVLDESNPNCVKPPKPKLSDVKFLKNEQQLPVTTGITFVEPKVVLKKDTINGE